MPLTFSPVSYEARPMPVGHDHRAACRALLHDLGVMGHVAAMGLSTIEGKRPDVISIDTLGNLIAWEVKTRFLASERQSAWRKYATSADMLIMVYPATVDLTAWHRPGWLPPDPTSRDCGALLWSSPRWWLPHVPRLLNPIPRHRDFLTQQLRPIIGPQPAP